MGLREAFFIWLIIVVLLPKQNDLFPIQRLAASIKPIIKSIAASRQGRKRLRRKSRHHKSQVFVKEKRKNFSIAAAVSVVLSFIC